MRTEVIVRAREALSALDRARDDLLAALTEIDECPAEDQVLLARELEDFRNRWTAVDVAVLTGLDRSDAVTTWCQGSLKRLLASALSISGAEARRRIQLYEQIGPRRSMLGDELGPIRPVLAEAVAAGEVSAEKATIISRGLVTIDRVGFDPAEIVAGEKLLVDDAARFSPEDLKMLTQRVVDGIDPDGTKPDEQLQRERRCLEIHPTADGGFAGQFRLTASCGVKLSTLLRPLTEVRVDNPYADQTGADDTPAAGARDQTVAARRARQVDDRTFGQRQHDALEEICDVVLRGGTVHENNAPVTVIVTIDEAGLLDRQGHATTTGGGLISSEALLEMADQADVYPVALDGFGVPLALGRTKRCASRHQTMALIARDVGCSFPGCAHPADYCERHHIVPWIEGGPTDLDNLTLLCIYHHHNFLQRGWTVELNEQRLPQWRPPSWIDPRRRPLINSRIRAAHRRC